jgi:hypothetical protein
MREGKISHRSNKRSPAKKKNCTTSPNSRTNQLSGRIWDPLVVRAQRSEIIRVWEAKSLHAATGAKQRQQDYTRAYPHTGQHNKHTPCLYVARVGPEEREIFFFLEVFSCLQRHRGFSFSSATLRFPIKSVYIIEGKRTVSNMYMGG